MRWMQWRGRCKAIVACVNTTYSIFTEGERSYQVSEPGRVKERYIPAKLTQSAVEEDDHRRARAVGCLMSLYQRRLASSTYALRHSLENRACRPDEALRHAAALAQNPQIGIPDAEILDCRKSMAQAIMFQAQATSIAL
jgi:hypothetical protein